MNKIKPIMANARLTLVGFIIALCATVGVPNSFADGNNYPTPSFNNVSGTNNYYAGVRQNVTGTNNNVVGASANDGGYQNVDVFGSTSATTSNTTYVGSSTNLVKLSGAIISGATTNLVKVAQGSTGYTNTTLAVGMFYSYATNGVMTVYAGAQGTNSIIVTPAYTGGGPNLIESFLLLPGYSVVGTNVSGTFVPGP